MTGKRLTAIYSESLSIRSAKRFRRRPRSEASIVRHRLPSLKASRAAFTAMSTSAYQKNQIILFYHESLKTIMTHLVSTFDTEKAKRWRSETDQWFVFVRFHFVLFQTTTPWSVRLKAIRYPLCSTMFSILNNDETTKNLIFSLNPQIES